MRSPAVEWNAVMLRLAVACAVLCHAAAWAADSGATRGGGLVPGARKTREELVRAWDLNADGTIDKGEAEVAASRMRLERAELRLNSGIDPVTGRPRGETATEGEPDDADMAVETAEPAEEPADQPDADASPTLPGQRVPRPRLPTPGAPMPGVPRTGMQAGGKPTAESGTRAAADRTRRALTGGVRAGGLPARAGYGTGVPESPRNAGLPVPQRPSPAALQLQQPRGGLVPAPRPTLVPSSRPAGPRDVYDPN